MVIDDVPVKPTKGKATEQNVKVKANNVSQESF